MRFMILVKANEQSEAGMLPTSEEIEAMGKYNEELVKAGVMVAGEGLHPSSKGFKVRFDGNERTIVDGPFTETKELVAGFWVLKVNSREEVIEWAKRIPFRESEVEVRQVFDPEDFGPELMEKNPEVFEMERKAREREDAEVLARQRAATGA